MRSRTEMVTTTFVDSEEDYSDEDDSEEDWRPSASNKNGKKVKQQQKSVGSGQAKRGRKRRNPSIKGNKNSKRKAMCDESEEDEIEETSEEDYDCHDYESISGSSKNIQASLPPKKQFSDKNLHTTKNDDKTGETLNLLVYIKDLTGTNPNKNNQLCLWRKDKNNLLQKYIRVKTSPEQFIFTSSSVYSSFEEKRISDFYNIKVKFIDTNNRRVKLINPSDLQSILHKNPNKSSSDEENLSDEKSNMENKGISRKSKDAPKKKHGTDPKYNEEDDEEEVEEENDEEEDDCDLEGDDDEDIEEDDEGDD